MGEFGHVGARWRRWRGRSPGWSGIAAVAPRVGGDAACRACRLYAARRTAGSARSPNSAAVPASSWECSLSWRDMLAPDRDQVVEDGGWAGCRPVGEEAVACQHGGVDAAFLAADGFGTRERSGFGFEPRGTGAARGDAPVGSKAARVTPCWTQPCAERGGRAWCWRSGGLGRPVRDRRRGLRAPEGQ